MFWTKILPILLIFTLVIPVQGTEPEDSVVFLIDLSGSIKSSDTGLEMLDTIAQCISMLPSHYQVSVLGFNDGLVLDLPFVSLSKGFNVKYLSDLVQNVPHNGYSNAGLGLLRAVERLEDGVVIFVSDGEILMPTQSATEESKQRWEEGIALAKSRNITLSTIGLGDWSDGFLLESLRETKGAFYPDSMALPEILQTMLQDDFHLPLKEYHQVTVQDQRIQWNLPVDEGDFLHLLVQSDEKIEEFSFDYPDSLSFHGDYHVVIHLVNPTDKEFDFYIKTQEESQIYLSLWGELEVFPEISYQYEDILGEDGNYYRQATTALLSFVNQGGEQVFLEDFSPQEVEINGVIHSMTHGEVTYILNDTEPKELVFTFSHTPLRITSNSLWLTPESTLLDSEREFSWGWYLLGFLGFVAFAVLLGRYRPISPSKEKIHTEKTSSLGQIGNKIGNKESKYPYVGTLKLELSIGREDFPMKQFSLFRVSNHRPIPLEEIVATCYEIPPMKDTENIIFSPWKDKSVALIHQSSATLLYNQTILRKNQRYTLPVGATLEVSLGDGHQLVIIYDLS